MKEVFKVDGMSCVACANSVETILSATAGVSNALVNFAGNTVLVHFDEQVTNYNLLKLALVDVGFILLPNNTSADQDQDLYNAKIRTLRNKFIGSAVLSLPVFVISMFFHHLHSLHWLLLVLSTPVLLWFGREFFVKAFLLARHKTSNMDTLVALGTGSAFVYSIANTLYPSFFIQQGLEPQVYYESAVVVITFLLLGKYLEEKARHQTTSSIRKLIGLQVKTAIVLVNKQWTEVPVQFVKQDDSIHVKPGGKIPVDGIITLGNTTIDESMISGESLPVEKTIGAQVIAGTVNQQGSFTMQAQKVGNDTLLAHIIKMVQEAQSSKAPVQRLADKIASVFVPTVLVISLLTFVLWFVIGPDPKLIYAFKALFAVLIIACPCALGLATPTALMVGIGKAAEQGILIKDAQSLENACKLTDLIVDKTGTLTHGKLTVTDIYPPISAINKDILSLVLATEQQSEHLLAQSICNYLINKNIQPSAINNIQNYPGKGIGFQQTDKTYYIGNKSFIAENNVSVSNSNAKEIERLESEGKTLVLVSDKEQLILFFALRDELKSNARQLVQELHQMNITVHLLSGDNESVVHQVATHCGINSYKAKCLPAHKALFIQQLQQQHKYTAMAGDGVNDSPALAVADVSFAMDSGSDIAVENAQITLVNGDLMKIVTAIKFSKQTMRTVKQNLFWAFFYNTLTIPVAAGILYPFTGYQLNPMLAGMLMAFSSVTVVFNSVLLRGKLHVQ